MINEFFLLCSALVVILVFAYKPVTLRIKTIIDNHVENTKNLINEANQTNNEAKNYLKKLEESLKLQNSLNQEKLSQSKYLYNQIKCDSEKEVEQEVKRQLKIAEIHRKTNEKDLVKEMTSSFISANIKNIMSNFNDKWNNKFITHSLENLSKNSIKKSRN